MKQSVVDRGARGWRAEHRFARIDAKAIASIKSVISIVENEGS